MEVHAFIPVAGSITFDLVRKSIIRRVGNRLESVGDVFFCSVVGIEEMREQFTKFP